MLDQLRSMIQKFDDTAYLGELLGAVAASLAETVDQTPSGALKNERQAAVDALSRAVEELFVFAEDDEWPEWEAVLDAVASSDLATRMSVVDIAIAVLEDAKWRAKLNPLNAESVDFALATEAARSALTLIAAHFDK